MKTLWPYQCIPKAAMIIGENMMGRGSNYACTLKATGQVCEKQEMISTNINHNFHQLLSP